MDQVRRVFLTAEWRDLVMLNFEVDPRLLTRYIPHGTTLDSFEGKTYVSLVGFRFLRTRMLGHLPIPLHSDFDEVNLRFYVRRKEGDENSTDDRRGVVFIAEIVPRRAIATIARMVYNENYNCAAIRHGIETNGAGKQVEFQWQVKNQRGRLWARTEGIATHPAENSLQQFITEHYWGYSAQRSGATVEYEVSHEPWRVWEAMAAGFEGDASGIYGHELGTIIQRRPDCAFLADGSPVTVFTGVKF